MDNASLFMCWIVLNFGGPFTVWSSLFPALLAKEPLKIHPSILFYTSRLSWPNINRNMAKLINRKPWRCTAVIKYLVLKHLYKIEGLTRDRLNGFKLKQQILSPLLSCLLVFLCPHQQWALRIVTHFSTHTTAVLISHANVRVLIRILLWPFSLSA